jgi:hypothetical protein
VPGRSRGAAGEAHLPSAGAPPATPEAPRPAAGPNRPPEPAEPPLPRRPSNRFVAGVLLGIMAIVAALAILFAWDPVRIRQHDIVKPKAQALSVPLILRFGLGVYILLLVYTVVRGVRRRLAKNRGEPAAPVTQMAWRFAFPALALAGLILIVLVVQTTPKTRPPLEPEPAGRLVRTAAPTELAGLAYLPADTELAVAVDVAGLVRQIPGNQSEDKLALVAEWLGADRVEKITGFRLTDLDHIVLGLSRDPDGPQYTLVVETVKPYDGAAFRRTLRPARTEPHGGKLVYRIRQANQPDALLWCAEPRMLVLVSGPTSRAAPPSLIGIPARARTGRERLPGTLRRILRARPLDADTRTWAAGRLSDRTVAEFLPGGLPLLDRGTALTKRLRTFRAEFRLEPVAILTADFQTADHAAAKELEKSFGQVQQLLSGLHEKEMRVSVRRDPKEDWVTLQIKAPRRVVLELLSGSNKRK